MTIRSLRTGGKALVFLAIVLIIIITLHIANVEPVPLPRWRGERLHTGSPLKALSDIASDAPPCQSLAGTDGIVVVMRTGATEIKHKLPVHFNTTFACYPDTLIFSDYAEDFDGHQVYDALEDVNEGVKQSNMDFEHYRRIQRLGREGLDDDELHGESWESGAVGKNENPGWRLDKWKFLPMIVRTLELRPEARWYVFVEPDSYVVWSNMVQWLHTQDPEKASYYGSEVQIGQDIFAHGGSAFVMSRPAMTLGAEVYQNNRNEWHERTANHWAGDCILGTALKMAGVPLTWSWPMFQGGIPTEMNWAEKKADKRLWCTPALSYHHFEASDIRRMWDFEQRHIQALKKSGTRPWYRRKDTVLHHRDVFNDYILPNVTAARSDWTNMSPDAVENSAGMTIEECQAVCEVKSACLQFSMDAVACSTSDQVKLGQPAKDVQSGWNVEGINKWASSLGSCPTKGGWTV